MGPGTGASSSEGRPRAWREVVQRVHGGTMSVNPQMQAWIKKRLADHRGKENAGLEEYVLAIVGNAEGADEDLRELWTEKLDDLLEEGTGQFVDELLHALRTDDFGDGVGKKQGDGRAHRGQAEQRSLPEHSGGRGPGGRDGPAQQQWGGNWDRDEQKGWASRDGADGKVHAAGMGRDGLAGSLGADDEFGDKDAVPGEDSDDEGRGGQRHRRARSLSDDDRSRTPPAGDKLGTKRRRGDGWGQRDLHAPMAPAGGQGLLDAKAKPRAAGPERSEGRGAGLREGAWHGGGPMAGFQGPRGGPEMSMHNPALYNFPGAPRGFDNSLRQAGAAMPRGAMGRYGPPGMGQPTGPMDPRARMLEMNMHAATTGFAARGMPMGPGRPGPRGGPGAGPGMGMDLGPVLGHQGAGAGPRPGMGSGQGLGPAGPGLGPAGRGGGGGGSGGAAGGGPGKGPMPGHGPHSGPHPGPGQRPGPGQGQGPGPGRGPMLGPMQGGGVRPMMPMGHPGGRGAGIHGEYIMGPGVQGGSVAAGGAGRQHGAGGHVPPGGPGPAGPTGPGGLLGMSPGGPQRPGGPGGPAGNALPRRPGDTGVATSLGGAGGTERHGGPGAANPGMATNGPGGGSGGRGPGPPGHRNGAVGAGPGGAAKHAPAAGRAWGGLGVVKGKGNSPVPAAPPGMDALHGSQGGPGNWRPHAERAGGSRPGDRHARPSSVGPGAGHPMARPPPGQSWHPGPGQHSHPGSSPRPEAGVDAGNGRHMPVQGRELWARIPEWERVTVQCTGIPWNNNLDQLSTHFSQFGEVVNIQLKPMAAGSGAGNDGGHTHRNQVFVQFATPQQAAACLESPLPVLNNRFIRVSQSDINLQPVVQPQQKRFTRPAAEAAAPVPAMAAAGATTGEQEEEEEEAEEEEDDAGTGFDSEAFARAQAKAAKAREVKALRETIARQEELVKASKASVERLEKSIGTVSEFVELMGRNGTAEEEQAPVKAKLAGLKAKCEEHKTAEAEGTKELKDLRSKLSVVEEEARVMGASVPPLPGSVGMASGSPGGWGQPASIPAPPRSRRVVNGLGTTASTMGFVRGSGVGGRGRGAPQGVGGRPWGAPGGRGWGRSGRFVHSVDNRPTCVKVEGLPEDATDENVKAHAAMAGDVEQVHMLQGHALVKFCNRWSAETFMQKGRSFGGIPLQLSWHAAPVPALPRASVAETDPVDESAAAQGSGDAAEGASESAESLPAASAEPPKVAQASPQEASESKEGQDGDTPKMGKSTPQEAPESKDGGDGDTPKVVQSTAQEAVVDGGGEPAREEKADPVDGVPGAAGAGGDQADTAVGPMETGNGVTLPAESSKGAGASAGSIGAEENPVT